MARFGAALKWLDGKCHRKYTAAGRVSETVRAVLLQPDARVKQAQAVAEALDISERRKPIRFCAGREGKAGASPPSLRCSTVAVRVKRCGKSAPLAQ